MYNKKRFYNRETNSAAFCVIERMSIKPLSLLCNLNNFLIRLSQPIMKKERNFSQYGEIRSLINVSLV